jgi:hypothetical protein
MPLPDDRRASVVLIAGPISDGDRAGGPLLGLQARARPGGRVTSSPSLIPRVAAAG